MPAPLLSQGLIGTWLLLAREGRDADGRLHSDPALGDEPLGLLIYDRSGRFAAQFMKRDRGWARHAAPAAGPALNNSRARGGYDAYFGTYEVDDALGQVRQRLEAALSPKNVGMVVARVMKLEGDALTIDLATTAVDGASIQRTLKWRRVA